MKKLCISIIAVCLVLICSSALAEYKDNGNYTITDTSTGLIWQKHGTYGSYTREDADQYIDNLNNTGPCKTWRLPSYAEIDGIYQYIVSRSDYNDSEAYWRKEIGSQDATLGYCLSYPSPGCRTQSAQIWAVHDPSWYSLDSNIFVPLKGSFWKVNYALNYAPKSNIIAFADDVVIDSNKAVLPCVDIEKYGLTMYGDYPDYSGRGFICTLSDNPPGNIFNIYQFNINNNTLNGKYVYLDLANPNLFQESILTGTKIQVDQNQPVQTQKNPEIMPINSDQLPADMQPVQQDQNQPIIIQPEISEQTQEQIQEQAHEQPEIIQPVEILPLDNNSPAEEQPLIQQDQNQPIKLLRQDAKGNKWGCFIHSTLPRVLAPLLP